MHRLAQSCGKLWRAFLDGLDAENARVWQAVTYITGFMFGGLYLLAAPGSRSAVLAEMGPVMHTTWTILLITSPFLVFIGTRVSDGWSGQVIQLTGNVVLLLMLATYIAATVQTVWGRGVFSLPLSMSFSASVLLFIVRDVRKLLKTERLARELSHDQ